MRKMALSILIGFYLPSSFVSAEPRGSAGGVRRQQQEAIQQYESKCATQGMVYDLDSAQCRPPQDGENVKYPTGGDRNEMAVESYGQACQKATESALVGCDLDSSPTMQVTMTMANMLRAKLEQDVGASPAALCSQMGTLAQTASAAHAAYNVFCTKGYISCQEACNQDIQAIRASIAAGNGALSYQLKATEESMKKCKGLSANLAHAKENIEKYANVNMMKSQVCKAKVTNAVSRANKACAINPLSPECMKTPDDSDCSNPNSTSIVCICNRNPSAPQCAGTSGGFGPIGASTTTSTTGGGGADSTAQALGNFGGLDGDEFSSGIGGALQPAKPGGDDGQSMARGGAGGGRGGGEFGGQGGGRGGSAGGGGSGYNAKTIVGYGVGGAGGRGGSYGGGVGGLGGNRFGGYGLANQKGRSANVDLRQFLPGGQMDPSRGLAGISGPDGITGPNSDIWKKINKRYFSVSPSLLP